MRPSLTRTKIIATVGPASNTKEKLWQLYMAGVQVFRLNFSHGTHEDQLKVINNIRDLNKANGSNITILQDLQGPKIRTRNVKGGEVTLQTGSTVRLSNEDRDSDETHITSSYQYLLQDVSLGDPILIDDGKIELTVIEKDASGLKAKVKYGGVLSSHKGINLPFSEVSEASMTEKDLKDLMFGIEHKVDWVALSFVRRANDIIALKEILRKHGSDIRVIAKLEKPQAIQRLDEIIEVADALMVARGDLGVEVLMEDVPMIQKLIVEKCNQACKPVIIATQMMESMIASPRPTRAESNDVANAILDGADAVMLSGETAVGQYPVETVESMCRTIKEMEAEDDIYFQRFELERSSPTYYNDSVILAGCSLVKYTEAAAIVGMTNSGYTALRLSTHRPKGKIFIFTNNRKLLTQLGLVWGVDVFYYDEYCSTDDTIADIKIFLVSKNLLAKGDVLINTGSMPIKEKKRTNMVKLSVI